jgi:eukaryotic-like serine/threonine-protein kinase
VPPDHVNAKLSAGLSEVVEMMMAKDPRKRYQSAKDLITDLKAVRQKQPPPLAHKDIGGMDLTQLAQAEAAAVTEIAVSANQPPLVRPWLFGLLIALLVISIGFNVFLLARGG